MNGTSRRLALMAALAFASVPLAALLAGSVGCARRLVAPTAADALLLLAAGPVIEEWLLRAGLQHTLLARFPAGGPWIEAVVALVAALAHGRLGLSAAVGVVGPALCLGIVYRGTRDWRACAVLHAVFNGAALLACSGPDVARPVEILGF
jgi:membrane protease YdiL (CAAX protease family)